MKANLKRGQQQPVESVARFDKVTFRVGPDRQCFLLHEAAGVGRPFKTFADARLNQWRRELKMELLI